MEQPASDLTLLLGPMWAGKTTLLIEAFEAARRLEIPVLAVKPRGDNRYSTASEIISHDQRRIPAVMVDDMSELAKEQSWDILIVDEAQFIPGLAAYCQDVLRNTVNKKIIIAGLHGNANGEAWPLVAEVLAVCTANIKFCKAKCEVCGKEAAFTSRRSVGPRVQVGGNETYFPSCTKCFYENLHRIQQA